ncbi:arginine--tRNA ligase [Flavobacterium sp.]|uniref:arginine--tRNA ligase n=1 Tax=Flavobacterium sp. TaxID=239 RepID=UPI00286AD49B|nr:arginine--tRNA ligase [Flavobacterium sp.]
MSISLLLTLPIQKAIAELFDVTVDKIEFQATRKEFEGDITLVLFPLLKLIKSNPVEIGNQLGSYLVENTNEVTSFNVVSGFLNIVISDQYYTSFFNTIKDNPQFGFVAPSQNEKAVMVEYSSPNTNKPLHLGHVRNNLLGYSVAEICKAAGKKVYKTQIINDRGIHICKSMLAWQKFGKEQTPESTHLKGDKLVGKFYVEFEQKLREETKPILNNFLQNDLSAFPELQDKVSTILNEIKIISGKIDIEIIKIGKVEKNINIKIYNAYDAGINRVNTFKNILNILKNNKSDEISEKDILDFEKNISSVISLENKESEKTSQLVEIARLQTSIMKEAQQMLLDWEAGKPEVMTLWKTMNGWVYDGFAQTYKNLGVDFDSYYYESNTYLLGKEVVQIGLDKGVFEKEADGSVWIDLTHEGLDRKIVLRSDGTAVYMTQDIGTAIQRVKDFPDVGGMVYTVGNEQDYHFKVLFLILKKLGFDWSANLFHLSYGMVDLPSGKMKSREGTVVDADDLMNDMMQTAKQLAEELGKLEDYSAAEKENLYKMIGLGALKYYILKVDPKKRILFNPEESVDFAGNTGPFIQYTYARIQSILRKADFNTDVILNSNEVSLHPKEKELIKQLELFPEVIQNAAQNHSPALIANYTYELVKEYNSFYQTVSILGEENLQKKTFRVQLSKKVGATIQAAFQLLGIEVPDRM